MIQLDDGVVDPEGGQGRQQVFDRLDRHRFAGQAGLVLDAAEVRDGRRDFKSAKIAALKADAVVGRGRLERQSDLVPGMKTDSGAGDGSTEGALSVHVLSDGKGLSHSGFFSIFHLSKASATAPVFVICPVTA